MFEIKKLDFGFIILCPNMNPSELICTIRSIKNSHPGCPFIAVVPNSVKSEITKEMKKHCEVYKGKDTIPSLMNAGLKNAPSEWSIFVTSGIWIKHNIANKYSRFIQDDSDILFPIFENIYDFKNGTINGLCINKKVFKKVGPFAEIGAINKIKEEWSLYAYGICGSKFKAILGTAIQP